MGRIWLLPFALFCAVGMGQTVRFGPVPNPVRPLTPLGGGTAVPAAAATVLKGLAAQAGVIFAGQVLEVRRNDDAGYVDVVFAIDQPVRGCAGSKRYVLREWAGLWAEEPQRYKAGRRLLMILTARGPSGMSAPVGGMAGRIPLVGMRKPPLVDGIGVAPADRVAEEGQDEAVDLRWVEAAANRPVVQAAAASEEVLKVSGWAGPASAVLTTVPSTGPGLSAVLAVLGGQ